MSRDRKLVLIVEDEQLLVSAIKRSIVKLNIDVVSANDGQTGLDLAFEKKPDLILLDIVLPALDGLTVLKKLREDGWGKEVPVLILSNLSRAESIAESKKEGANEYLVKTDWKLSEVVEKVKHELGII